MVYHSTDRLYENKNMKDKVDTRVKWILALNKGRRKTGAFNKKENLGCWLGYEKSLCSLVTESLLSIQIR